MPKTILAAKTAEDYSVEFSANYDADRFPLSMSAPGLGAGETVTLQYYTGSAWADYYEDGVSTPVQVSQYNSMVSVWAFGIFRGHKSATVAAVPVLLHTNQNP